MPLASDGKPEPLDMLKLGRYSAESRRNEPDTAGDVALSFNMEGRDLRRFCGSSQADHSGGGAETIRGRQCRDGSLDVL